MLYNAVRIVLLVELYLIVFHTEMVHFEPTLGMPRGLSKIERQKSLLLFMMCKQNKDGA